MLTSTFVHLAGIGPSTERRLWQHGVREWSTFLQEPEVPGISPGRKALYDGQLLAAQAALDQGDAAYFARCLHSRDHWRLFHTFGARALYLDIETTGTSAQEGAVTVVGLYRSGRMTTLIRHDSLSQERLQEAIDASDLLITFFGSVFDVPYLKTQFPGLRVELPHFDLCFAARRLGLQGGLKQIERELDITRADDLQGLDGWEAVQLWQRHCSGDEDALDRLVRYNEADTKNLEPLAVMVYEQLVAQYGPPAATTFGTGTR
ncbi:MAG: ribonuclease H-like domain-containing protein [Nitrospiraceae bacterium]|nr:ribonuclease H-like domain-containing protein [Nitrospiraceae bacterium]